MVDIFIANTVRPNRFEAVKDEAYHLQYARYCAGQGLGHQYHRAFIINNLVYYQFYNGNQWILNEDLGAFLNDESGNARNRIRMCENVIRPMVEQYIGNAINMQFNAKAFNVSPLSISRKDEALMEMLLNTKIANQLPEDMGNQYRADKGVAKTEEDTAEIFENVYVDKFTKNVNAFLRWSKEHNEFDQSLKHLSKQMALYGAAVHKGYEMNGWHVWNVQDVNYWFFDRGARRPDLKDAHYMGDFNYMLPTDIFERWQDISTINRKIIENFSVSNTGGNQTMFNIYGVTQDRVPVIETYWKDAEKQQYGYVMDGGYEKLVQVNEKKADGSKPRYTDKDLIEPQNEDYKKFIGKGKKRDMYVDVLRYCIFVPSEIVGGDKNKDIVLEYGIVPYQQDDTLSPFNIEFPYCCNTWNYYNGEIHSPIADVISPQRMLNRALSAADAIINNARLSGTAIEKNAIDAQGGEEELNRNMNQGKPILLDSRGIGIPNAIGTYGANSAAFVAPFMEFANSARTIIQNVTGVNEAMQGTGNKSSDLGVVNRQRIEMGSLLQENFYDALAHIMLQTYQSEVGTGLRIYADSKRKLSLMIGDEGAEEIIISNKMLAEQFRVFIKRAAPDKQQKQEALTMGLQMIEIGLIGEKQMAELAITGDIDDLGRLMNQYRREKMYAQRKAQEQQALAAEQEREDNQKLVALEQQNKDTDRQQLDNVGKEERQNKKDLQLLRNQGKGENIVDAHILETMRPAQKTA